SRRRRWASSVALPWPRRSAWCFSSGRFPRPGTVPDRARETMWYLVIMLAVLELAAVLEVGGAAAIRHGLLRAAPSWLAAGAFALVSYGFVVNANRLIDFGRLMGLYIVVFFVVSQVIDAAAFGGRPSPSLLVGGALIVIGGAVIQLGGSWRSIAEGSGRP